MVWRADAKPSDFLDAADWLLWPILLKKSAFKAVRILPAESAFLHAATRNLSPETSAKSKNFKLKRVLFCHRNHGRLFPTESANCCRAGLQSVKDVVSKEVMNV